MAITKEKALLKVAEIEQSSKLAANAYKPTPVETDTLLEIIEEWGKKKMDQSNPALKAMLIIINVIDKMVAKKLKDFLDKNPKLDNQLYQKLAGSIMRISGN